MTEEKKLLIIDSNALLHRSFHALPPLTTKSGEQTGAAYGFLLTLFKAIKDLNPNYIAACFDLPAPTFRHVEFKEYKAGRPKTPDELISQIPKIKEILKSLKIPVFEKSGFEADDLIATITKFALKEEGLQVYIVTGDMDTLQLVGDRVRIYTLGRGIKDTVIYDKDKVVERLGVGPSQVVDFKTLAGDPSDNIPGVEGIGKKTASDLLVQFKDLKGVYNEAKKTGSKIKERTRGLLLSKEKEVELYKKLVQLNKDADIGLNIKEIQFGGFDFKEVESVLKKFEFNSLIKRLDEFKKEEVKNQKSLL